MSRVVFHYVDGELHFLLSDGVQSISPGHPSYAQIKRELETLDETKLRELLDVNKALASFVAVASDGAASVKDGVVYYDGEPVHNAISTRILEFMRLDLPFSNLLKFLENIKQNPSFQSQKELFDFLDRKGMPITEDGCFLAFKAVSSNYMDKYSGRINNRPGKIVTMTRPSVDDNRANQCSAGLHVGAMEYVGWYGHGDDILLVVKVNPRDAVSVPLDHNASKLRTCQYEVLHEYTGKLSNPLYGAKGEEVASPVDDEKYNWDWADEDDDDDDDVVDAELVDEEDDDYDWDDEDDDWDDDDDVTSQDAECCGGSHCDAPATPPGLYGIKPAGGKQAGRKYHNKRGGNGRFS